MPEKKYFLRLGGAFLLGAVALILAGLAFVVLLPYIIIAGITGLLLLVLFIAIWAFIYIAMVIGVGVYYLFKPMKVSEKKGRYTISSAREAGRRSKGKTRRK